MLGQEIYYDMSRDIALSVDGAGYYRQGMAAGFNLDLDTEAVSIHFEHLVANRGHFYSDFGS
jgi:hypothetical protein